MDNPVYAGDVIFTTLSLMTYEWLMLPTYILAYSAFFTAIIAVNVDYVLVHIPMQTPTIGLRMNVV